MLRPKQTKYRKWRKYPIKNIEYHSNDIKFGSFGLKAIEGSHVTAKQIEATRRIITRKLKRNGKVLIRIFPHIPITSKPIEVRMGKGKGAVSHYIAPVKPGTLVFEVDGVSTEVAKDALLTASKKLPVKCAFVDRNKP